MSDCGDASSPLGEGEVGARTRTEVARYTWRDTCKAQTSSSSSRGRGPRYIHLRYTKGQHMYAPALIYVCVFIYMKGCKYIDTHTHTHTHTHTTCAIRRGKTCMRPSIFEVPTWGESQKKSQCLMTCIDCSAANTSRSLLPL